MLMPEYIFLDDEMEKASKNLPQDFFMEFEAEYTDTLHSTCHIWLFPYSKEHNSLNEDIGTYYSDTKYSILVTDKKSLSSEMVLIRLDKIPFFYDFIDIYAIGYSDRKLNATLKFSEKKEKDELFSYGKHFGSVMSLTGGIDCNIFLGTLGRVTDGWKFYPKIEPCRLEKNDIIEKYRGLSKNVVKHIQRCT